MIGAGLSLEQAPPISVPLRFFLAAPVGGLAASAALAWQGPLAFTSRAMPGTLAATHLLTLGFLTMAMAGALLQMLPVVAGAPVAKARLVAWLVQLPLAGGTAALVGGFLTGRPQLFQGAVGLLGLAMTVLLAALFASLVRARSAFATVSGMWLSALSLALTAGLGLVLAAGYGGSPTMMFAMARNHHPLWGLAGWVGLLVIGVAYQVVPMFQLTAPYPRAVTLGLAPALFALLLVATFVPVAAVVRVAGFLAAAGFGFFAALTWWLQARRRRRLADVTLLFWRVALASLGSAALLWAGLPLVPPALLGRAESVFALLAIVGFGTSVVEGMLYKIVPFLSWFHLQSRYLMRVKIPHMKQLQPDAPARRQWMAHVGALVTLLAAALGLDAVFFPAVLLFAASQALLGWNLVGCVRRYAAVCRAGEAAPAR